ncbi:MAG TPA: polysaccharide biosynthesis tyrosine autokinase [Gemmatirosa sp.]|nr:polysaccharide biosynthesis tyrosine autokinase [Gemmatirosa sp.]
MSANLPSAAYGPSTAIAPVAPGGHVPAAYRGQDGEGGGVDTGQMVSRLLGALNRFKWLILGLVLAGAGVGAVLGRFVDPQYQVASTIILTGDVGPRGAPVQVDANMERQGWIDLARSFAIADTVVMRLALYIEPDRAGDSLVFRNFQLDRKAGRFVPGEYRLELTGPRYTLRDKVGFVSEEGVVGDSIGRRAGFAWQPPRAALGTDRTIKFTVRTPREASVSVLRRMNVELAEGSNLMLLQLAGTVQQKPAETLNAWGEQFVSLATQLKSGRVTGYSRTLRTQLADADQRLRGAERAYQQFRVGAITLPSEGMTAKPAGAGDVAVLRDPAVDRFFEQSYVLNAVRRDRLQLERLGRQLSPTSTPVEAMLSVPTVVQDPAAVTLRNSLQELVKLQQEVRVLRETYTDSFPTTTKPRLELLRTLQGTTIPQQLSLLLAELRRRENETQGFVSRSAGELQGIPQRTMQQEALRRELQSAEQLYTTLQQRFAEAELSEKSLAPDIRVLDAAVMPLDPSTNTAPRLFATALVAALGLGLGLAVLLDRMDRRFRYPSQATNDLGLQVLGVVPQVQQDRRQSPEKVAQIVEAFRSIRMNVKYASMPTQKVALTITSPGAGDGKSLVASNLALSFAEGGWRTVLVDGDLRRGALHATFDLPSGPGVVEYLEGTSLLGEIVQATSHDNLSVIAGGARHRRAPELLATPRMQQLVSALAAEYDAIIIDTPPLGAGTDAYAIGTTTQSMAIVLRTAATDLKLAKAKLETLDQLPVVVIGAILNEVDADASEYQYFAYDPEYAAIDEESEPSEPTGRIGAGV